MTSRSTLNCRTSIAHTSIDQLVREFGSPLFVFDERSLRTQFRCYRDAFVSRYPKTLFAWSYKTNYLQAICTLFHQEGAAAEIVSTMEWEKARKLAIPGERIIFNGPNKRRDTLREAIIAGARVNIDHFDELQEIEEIAADIKHPIDVGLRLSLDVGEKATWARFGLSVESGDALRAAERMVASERLRLRGLHCHIATFVLDASRYANQVGQMLRFAYEVEDRFGWRIDDIDVGGGFASRCRLRHSKPGKERPIPTADDYATAIVGALRQHLRPGHEPELIIESGRALVDNAGYLITSVVARKQLPDGTPFYVLDAGTNLLSMLALIEIGVETVQPNDDSPVKSMLCGPLCMNTDIVRHEIDLPKLKRGDQLVLSPAGAYNVTQSMPFIDYRPAVVMIRENGTLKLIRAREDLTDIDRREIPLDE